MAPNRVYEIGYHCEPVDPRDEPEDGSVTAYWTGEIDGWGKLTIRPVDGRPPLYLFRREIVSLEEPS